MNVVEDREKSEYYPKGLIIASILGVAAWLVFILIYALDWSRGYSLFQNLIVTGVSFSVVGLLIGVLWVAFAPRAYWRGNQ